MADEYMQAIVQAISEYKELYTKDLKFVKNSDVRAEVMRGVASRARDIYRENMAPTKKFTFTITVFDLEKRLWDRCPGCGDPDINKDSNGHSWQGCYKCDILLGSNGTIKSMDHSRTKKEEPFGAKVEAKV